MRTACCILFALPAAPAALADVVVTTLEDDAPQRAISLRADARTISLQTAEGKERRIETPEVVEVSWVPAPAAPAPRTRPFEVELIDGTRLRGVIEAGAGETVRVRSPIFRETVTHLDLDPDLVYAIRRVVGKMPAASRLVRFHERDTGYRRKGGARVLGDLERFTATGVRLVLRDNLGVTEITFEDLAALFLENRLHEAKPGLRVVARTADGSAILLAKGFRIAGGTLTGTTPCGIDVRIATRHLVALGFEGLRFEHLSDRKPASIKRKPFFPVPEGPAAAATLDFLCPVRTDRSPDGRGITLGKRRYFKGVGVRPHTEIRYDLGGRFAEFRAVCGIDDEVMGPSYGRGAGTGSVVFRVLVDGKERWKSAIAEGGKKPQRVRVRLRGAKTLTLVVALVPEERMPGGGPDSPELDNAVWARPLLIR